MTPDILYCGYRDWAKRIFENIDPKFKKFFNFHVAEDEAGFNDGIAKNPDLAFFIGWSSILKADIVSKYKCICLHPSPLPKYKGGSPLQNQIIRGEKNSAVTFFFMDEKIDHGPIILQKSFPLYGNLSDIYDRIVEQGSIGINHILDEFMRTGNISSTPQNHDDGTYFKRRKPEESEIKLEDFQNFTAEQIYDKIRALQDPYPNAFVVCKDGTKLYIQYAKFGDKE